ncbi:MAG: RNA methyltransferase [Candidatus Marinimicrobia bacterium]|nr:RNA methyltransferase [Candidatus Neomarinimicrobiota bacterium]|tara:strand:- start:527 stop:1066 length:540 start_codon:yes stop_codon:yes gene_type:complete
MRIKRTNDELKADRPTIKELINIDKFPIYVMLENIRSVHNVGSILRSADGIGVSKVYLTGYTPFPPRKDLSKTALGADQSVNWEHYENPLEAIKIIRSNKITPIVIEQTVNSKSIFNFKLDLPVCFIFGNEVSGVSEDILEIVDLHAEIPMRGVKQSLNVAVSVGIVGYESYRQHLNKT